MKRRVCGSLDWYRDYSGIGRAIRMEHRRMRKIRVSAPARIHMGILNPSPGTSVRDRLYASVGVGIKEPRTIVEVEPGNELRVNAPFTEECKSFARKILDHYKLNGARIDVRSVPPRHAGLGSTTQLSLSIATGITRAYDLDLRPVELARVLGRGKQSAIGTYAFQHGGFIVEGGWGDNTTFPPLLLHYDFPEDWRFLIVIPESRSFDETQELEVFEKLPSTQEKLVYEACYRILLGMAPAVLEKNIKAFGENLTKLQEVVGSIFSEVQGGIFQPHSAPLIEKLSGMGAIGVGQSSWGPAVYALFDPEDRETIECLLKEEILYGDSVMESGSTMYGVSEWGEVYFTQADNNGATVVEV
ncbi:MAG: beta-ribofuranosylaminobenzene 5'-phosphate synthase family protein [Candidatus Methanospirareceae archaeon]